MHRGVLQQVSILHLRLDLLGGKVGTSKIGTKELEQKFRARAGVFSALRAVFFGTFFGIFTPGPTPIHR